MPKNWVNPNKQLQERTQRENEQIKRERERQQKIERGKKQGWVNPNLYTPRERMDRYLESQGMLNYQRKAQPQTISNPHLVPSGGNADRPQNFVQGTDPVTGKPVISQQVKTNATSPYAPMVFAKPEQVQQGQAGWQDLSSTDRQAILKDPKFYKGNQITKYTPAIQQEILADPNFDWKQLPAWQRVYYSLSSNPAAMGAVQGLAMSAGNPGGALLGAPLGWSASVVGYDPNKEFYKQGDNKFTFDKNQAAEFARGAFGLLNWGAEQVEKGVGVLVKSAAILTGNDPNFDPNKRNLDIRFNENFSLIPGKNFDPNLITGSTWNAGAGTFEAIAPSFMQMASQNPASQVSPLVAVYDLFTNPEKYKGTEYYLGAANAEQLQTTFYERLQQAEDRVKAGEDYRTVATEMQAGIIAQVGDMAGQGIADPLNYAGLAETAVGKVASDITGDKIAAEAFRQSAMSESPGVMNAKDRIKNIINTPGEAIKIDPNYKVQELGSISKWMAGLNSQGQIKAGGFTNQGLLDYKPPKKNVFGFIEYLANQTPESRARVGQDLLVSNVGRIMASYFNGTDVEGFANWWKAFSKGDMTQAADLSRAMANSPEFYTVLPAAANFDMDAALAKWTASADARDAVTRVADALGENPMSMIEDMAKRGTAEQDFTRLKERLAQSDTPEARAILAEIDNGRFTPEILQDTIKLFSNGDVPYHPGQWMAQTLGDIQKHYDTWAVDHFKLDAEAKKTLFRMSAVLKSAQSVLLLGANPGYMISNVLPTMVTRAMSGVWGYMTPKAIDNFLTRMGFSPEAGLMPNRLDEGVGPGGLVDQTRVQGDAIREATRGTGTLTKIEDAIGKVGRNMPFNKLSRLLEGYEGTQAYLIGMKKAWGESWRRGKGFRELPTGLVNELQRVVGPRAADILYSAIEAGMNKTEIQNIVSSATGNIQSRTLINEAATRLNIPASKAAAMMEQAGVFDALDASLKNAKTEAQINRAFERAAETTKRQLDQQTARDAVANIEHVANKLQTEGVKAVTDIILDTEDAGIEKWLQHYQRMGEVADAVENIDNPQTRSNLWSLKYAESSAEFRRHNAHKGSVYLGVLKALGEDTNPNGRALLANLASTDAALDTAYRTMRQLRDEHFSKWNNDWENPRRQVERTNVERQIEQAWNRATKTEIENSRKFGELLGNQYEATFGVEAGEAARQAWEQITAFRKEMTDRRDAFRRSLEGLPATERQAVSKKFWGETYKYMIAEMQRIKTEAITQLDRIANNRRNGGDMTGPLSPNDPNAPTQPPAGTTPDEYTRLRQQAEERQAARQAKIDAVWEVANQYGYSRENTSGLFSLLGALKSEEYGGDPNFTGGLKEATDRWTPDEIDAILEKRRQIYDTNNQERIASRNMEYQAALQRAAQDASKRTITENTPLIEAVRRHGGIDWSYVEQVTGEKKPPINQRSIFSKTGKNRWGLDEMARILADDGYPIDLNSIDDPGGIQQTVDLIQRAYRGEQIFPMGSPRGEALLDASLARAEADYIDNLMTQDEFKPQQWETDVMDAVESMDFTRLSTLIEQLPPDIGDQPYSNVTGETYNEFISRTWDETEARMKDQEQAALIADNTARSERAMQDVQTEAQTGFTRAQFRESLTEVFGLTDDMADAVMDITDARANAYGDVNEWYRTRIADVQKAGEIDLAQEAFHGSPYKFDKFTLDKIGTGEGAQAYGWGLYFAGDKAVADWYRKKLSKTKVTYQGKDISGFANTELLIPMIDMFKHIAEGKSVEEAKRYTKRPYESELKYYQEYGRIKKPFPETLTELPSGFNLNKTQDGKWSVLPSEQIHGKPFNGVHDTPELAVRYALDVLNEASDGIRNYQEKLDLIDSLNEKDFSTNGGGQLYSVDIPDEGYLLWDRPLSEQNISIDNILDAIVNTEKDYRRASRLASEDVRGRLRAYFNQEDVPANTFYRALSDELGSPKAASLALKEAGINGIKYLDGSSRNKGEGNYNYVVFDDSAINILETYYQSNNADGVRNPKAGVRFMEDGRAIIRAWEGKADVSSIAHELGHIFRRDLQGGDLRIIEQWAEVKNGNWTRASEEKFARGFEKYLADGSAPTPKLRRVFEQFKVWMTGIYRAITGSPIDIDLTPQVKEVFDRLLTGQEQPRSINVDDQLFQMGYDPKAYYLDPQGNIKRRGELKIGVDRAQVAAETDAILSSGMIEKLKQLKKTGRTGEGVDTNVTPRRGQPHELSYGEFKANILQEQKARAEAMLDRLAKVEAGDLPQDNVPDLMRSTLKKVRDDGGVMRYKSTYLTLDEVRTKYIELRDRNTISYEMYGDVKERWMQSVERALTEDTPVPDDVKQAYYAMKKTSGERMQGAGTSELFQIETQYAKNMDYPKRVPDTETFRQAVENTPNATLTEDGVVINLVRRQKPEQSGSPSVRTGVFYLVEGDKNLKYYKSGNNGYGGMVEIKGETLLKAPFEAKGSTGGKAPEFAYDAILGKGSYQAMRSYVLENINGYRNDRSTAEILMDYGYEENAANGLASYIDEYSKQGNQKAYAIQEAIVAEAVRNEGYDSIVGISKRRDGTPFIAEVFDLRESTYPTEYGDFNINPQFGGDWLFQDADPRMPLGAYDESAGWMPQSQAMDEVWAQEFQPLLDGMRNVAVENLNNPTMTGMYSQLSPEAQTQLNNYLKGVQSDMASTKMAAQRWGQDRRDYAMLNYNSRTGFDQWLDIAFPYQFFYTRSMMTWASRIIDKPAILSNYARIRKQQDRYENNLPERLRGKMRIEAPYLPDWMGDALYIDPLSVLFTPHNFLRPFEQMAKDNNMQVVEAERILQEWSADGQIPEDQIIEAAKNRSGTVWERALAEAKIRREAEISNPMDFVSATFGPAWYLTTAAKLLGTGKDGAETLTELPLTRTARAVDTVTQNTWAEPIGNLIGLLAKPEEKFREANNLPEFGEYGDYYIDRNIANMVAEGLITSEDAQIAMIERQGQIFEQARERTKMELAMRIPLMGATYAGLNSDNFFAGLGNFVKALPASLFGAGVLPEGELQYRGLKQEWNDAWKLRDAGDEQAITRFFNEHPEYEAYLAKGKEPEERLRSFLVGQIWDGYMALGTTDRKSATAEMGDEFKQSFLDSETRSYDTISIETLTQWAQMVKKKVPNTPQTLPAIQNPRTVDYLSPEVTKVTDQYFEQRNRLYPNYYELQTQYYNLPKSQRRSFLVANPQLAEYWKWNRDWKARYPDLEPVFNGQVFKRVDTTTWNPLLVQYVADYAYSGTPLGPGAYKALEQVWINEGMPRGDFETWLKSDVTPSFLYGQ